MNTSTDEPKGLGGWLVLPGIGLIITPFTIMWQVLTEFVPIFRDGYWEVLTTPGSEAYHWLWGPTLIFELLGNAVLAVFAVFLLALYFMKNYRFPKLYIAFLAFNVVFLTVDLVAVYQVLASSGEFEGEGVRDLFRGVVGALIWIPYMLTSKRVKNTFVKDSPVDGAPIAPGTMAPPITPS